MKVVVRQLTDEDRARLSGRVRYWGYGTMHSGLVCCDTETGDLFVQEPTHPSVEGISFHALVDHSFLSMRVTRVQQLEFFDISPVLWGRLGEVRAFAWTSLKLNQLGWNMFVPSDNPTFVRVPAELVTEDDQFLRGLDPEYPAR